QAHTLAVQVPDQPVWATVDFTRIAQALANLLSNAAKYTEPHGRISVALSSDAADANIVVSDTGIGIPAALLPRIFDMFTQLQAHRDRTYGGLGVGLTLARRLLQLHGGTITAASEGQGRGSQFTIRLPLEQTAEETAPRSHGDHAAPSVAACRILIAEDSQ